MLTAPMDEAFETVNKGVTQTDDVRLIRLNKYKKTRYTQLRNSKEQKSHRFEQAVDRSVNQQILY